MKNPQIPDPPTSLPNVPAPPPPPGPLCDVSRNVLSLAREIDRLPPGEYVITLNKPTSKHQNWIVQIDRTETIREMNIPAKIVQTHENRLVLENGAQLTQKGGVVNPSVLP
jgi:hypothetical protein